MYLNKERAQGTRRLTYTIVLYGSKLCDKLIYAPFFVKRWAGTLLGFVALLFNSCGRAGAMPL